MSYYKRLDLMEKAKLKEVKRRQSNATKKSRCKDVSKTN